MDISRFKETLASFLDSGDQVEIEKGTLMMQFGNEFIEAQLRQSAGMLNIVQDGKEVPAEQWIVRRLAMLDLLADRILTAVPDNPSFVVPAGSLLDEIQRAPSEQATDVEDAVSAVEEFLSRKLGGTCSVLYLTSDAGEGKTTVINHLARLQAQKFRTGEADWLLVPISLGGRPFLRFDDVVVAAFMNQLRFQRLYFDAFLQLVRMGVLVPALDGFEEIFVETSDGEAVSSLGTLIRRLGGEGTLLIAARKAYFEFRSLDTQARLLDGLPDVDVAFGRVALKRWGRREFIEYATLSGLPNAEAFYDSVVTRLSAEHPLVTRAVLVRRLVELAKRSDDPSFVESLRPDSNEIMGWLVDKLLEREATEKWIDKLGEPPRPLLSVNQHHELLGNVSEEMWISKTSVLNADMLDSLADIFSEDLSPVASRQVRERLKQHALIVATSTARREFSFDHDDFREFFLGEKLAQYIMSRKEADARKLLRIDLLPFLTFETATQRLRKATDTDKIVEFLQRVASSESSSTFVRENVGGLVAGIMENTAWPSVKVTNLMFPVDVFKARLYQGLDFSACYFRSSSLQSSTLKNCQFSDCEFEHLFLFDDTLFGNVRISKTTSVHCLTINHGGETVDYYSPEEIAVHLTRRGASVEGFAKDTEALPEISVDDRLRIAEKAIQTFNRCTHVNEGVFKLRLSVNSNLFFTEVLPDLLQAGVMQPVPKGAGGGQFYKMGISLTQIAKALAEANGSYDKFLALLKK